ncbi:MAG: hypothetical protein AAFR66_03755 [Bacteroidota bacterium]
MKKIVFNSLCMIALFLWVGVQANPVDDTPTIRKTFSMSGPGQLQVTTSGGKIEVNGTSGNEVEVNVFVKRNGRVLSANDDFMSELTDGFEIKIAKEGNTVVAYTKRKDGARNWWNSVFKNVSFHFEVNVPKEMSAELKTSGGRLYLANVDGEHTLRTSGGGISMVNVSGDTDASTSGGGIKVSGQKGSVRVSTSGGGITIVESEGDIYGRTSGGGIKLENNRGDLDVSTSGGPIRISGYAESVKASTSGGGIDVNISGLTKKLSLSTSGGGIRARVPAGVGMDLDLHGGRVNVDEISNFRGSMKKNHVSGSINGGGIPVRMHTSGGSVNFAFN